jgi:hypothetical protein
MNPWEKTENFEGDVAVYYANLQNHLNRFKKSVFVETGTYIGNGLKCALNAGFEKCYSIEIHKHLYDNAVSRFNEEIKSGKVELHYGDSSIIFNQIIEKINLPTTFWLDAHISAQYGEKLAKNCPILDELESIKNSFIKTHTILIDDLVCFGNAAHDFIPLSVVQNKILEINPAYKFELLDASIPQNILVAYV